MSDIKILTEAILAFRDARDWKQFHNPKDVAVAVSLEAAEVLELFHWKSKEEVEAYVLTHREEIGDELADVLYNLLLLAHETGVDLVAASHRKMQKNIEKYPVEKARGKHTKYNKL